MINVIRYHLDAILVFAFAIFIVGGCGYLITSDMAQQERQYNECIGMGKQYVNGGCVN